MEYLKLPVELNLSPLQSICSSRPSFPSVVQALPPDLNQTQVARAIHVAQTTYSDYEKGKVRIPVECLIQLAKFYDVDMNYITGVSDTLQPFPHA